MGQGYIPVESRGLLTDRMVLNHCIPIKFPNGSPEVSSEGQTRSRRVVSFKVGYSVEHLSALLSYVVWSRRADESEECFIILGSGDVRSRGLLGISSRAQVPMSCDLDAGTRLLVAFGCNRVFRGDSLFLMPSLGVLRTGSESCTCDLV